MRKDFVEYLLKGKKHTKAIEAFDPGHAFQKAIRKLPKEAQVTRCHVEGRFAGRANFARVWIDYEAPKNIRLTYPKFKVDTYEQTTMELGL
jgi:hypothetical protein